MTDIYTYRIDIFTAEPIDFAGYDVEAADGHIGKIDEATFDDGSSCLIVDTGFWIFGKKRMIPAGVVATVDVDEKRVHISMSKDEVKDAPDFDEQRHAADEHGHHDEQAEYYRSFRRP